MWDCAPEERSVEEGSSLTRGARDMLPVIGSYDWWCDGSVFMGCG